MNENARILAVAGLLAALVGCAGEASGAASVAPGLDVLDEGVAGQGAVAPEGDDSSDPFTGEMPDFMVDAAVQRIDGELLDLSLQRALFDYANAHPKDPRPWLLLAGDSMAREFYGSAVRQYGSALEADESVKNFPSVLLDLQRVIVADGGVGHGEATALVVAHWGKELVPSAAE